MPNDNPATQQRDRERAGMHKALAREGQRGAPRIEQIRTCLLSAGAVAWVNDRFSQVFQGRIGFHNGEHIYNPNSSRRR